MVLPAQFPSTDAGVGRAIRKFSEALGRPVVAYIKAENQISVDTVGALVKDKLVCAIKYAVVRENPKVDPFLKALIDRVGVELLVSGIGERPAIEHFRDFGLQAFTSGSICVGPRGSMRLLEALKQRLYDEAETLRAAYLPIEDCRDAISPIRVLHDAVTLAGIADMGPMLPLLSNLDQAQRARLEPVAKALRAHDETLSPG